MTYLAYIAAALAEIAGCFAFWACWRLGSSPIWLIPGIICLIVFAWLLSLPDTASAGRSFAAYGGIYIVTSLIWMWRVEDVRPDLWDIGGAMICLVGAAVILLAPRPA